MIVFMFLHHFKSWQAGMPTFEGVLLTIKHTSSFSGVRLYKLLRHYTSLSLLGLLAKIKV